MGGSLYFYGVGGSGNTVDFQLNYVSSLTIDGNRWENGKKFLHAAGQEGHSTVMISNSSLGAYNPEDGYVILVEQPGTIILDAFGVYKDGGGMYTGPVVHLASTWHIGNFHWRGGYVQSTSSTLVKVQNAANWKQRVTTVGKMDANYKTPDYFPDVTT